MPHPGFIWALTLLVGFFPTLGKAGEGPYALYRSEAPYPDVVQALKLAIEEQGLYINNILHMGDMLERTGRDLGLDQPIYARAESIEFCSARLSRRMVSENPARILNCPYLISVYVLPQEPKTTYLVHRRVNLGDETPIMDEVEAMLEALARTAAQGF